MSLFTAGDWNRESLKVLPNPVYDSMAPWEHRRWCWQQGLPLAQSWRELGTVCPGPAGRIPSLRGRMGAEHFEEFVCLYFNQGKEIPWRGVARGGIGWVLFPEKLEWLQETPSAPPGKLDITRLVLGVALSPPPLPTCLIRFPEPSTPLPSSNPTGTSPPGSAVLFLAPQRTWSRSSQDRGTCQGCTEGYWDGSARRSHRSTAPCSQPVR